MTTDEDAARYAQIALHILFGAGLGLIVIFIGTLAGWL